MTVRESGRVYGELPNWPEGGGLCVDTIAGMRDFAIVFVHLIVTLARLARRVDSVPSSLNPYWPCINCSSSIAGASVGLTCVPRIGSSPACVRCSCVRHVAFVPPSF